MVMGMTYDQFWNDDVELVKFYREAFQLKQQLKEQDLWLQGAYFCEAISACFSDKKNKVTYPEKPHGYLGIKKAETAAQKSAKEELKKKQAYEKTKIDMELWAARLERKFKKKGGEENGS